MESELFLMYSSKQNHHGFNIYLHGVNWEQREKFCRNPVITGSTLENIYQLFIRFRNGCHIFNNFSKQ